MLLPLLVLAAVAPAQDPGSLARLLPAETPAYIEIRDPLPEEAQGMALYQCLKEPALQAVLERLMGDQGTLTAQSFSLGPAGVVLKSDLREMRLEVRYVDRKGERTFRMQNRFALAWVGLVEADFPVDMVLALEVDTDAENAVETIKRIIAAVSLDAREEKRGDVDAELKRLFRSGNHAGVAYAHAYLEPVHLYLAPVGQLVVLTTTEARMRECIERHRDGGKGSLAEDERFRAMLANAKGEGTATFIIALQIDRTLDVLQAAFGPEIAMARAALQQIGLGGLESLTNVSRVDGRGATTTMSIVLSGERWGAARLFAPGEPASFGGLAFAPRDSFYVMSGNFDAGGLYQIFLESGGAMIAGGFQAAFQNQVGYRFREDLLDLVGPEATLILAPNRGLIPDVGVAFESKDAAKLERNLVRLLETMPWPAGTGVQEGKIGGVPVHVVPLGHPQLAQLPIAPTFGVVDGHLVLTAYPLVFQRLVAVKRKQQPSLLENADFVLLRSRVPEDALGISYLDLPRAVEFLYDTLIPILQALPQQTGSAPLMELPEVSLMTRYLYGRISWRVADERGLHFISHAPIDTSGMLIGGAIGVAATAMLFTRVEDGGQLAVAEATAVARPRDGEARTCHSRVRLLRARIRMFQLDHDRRPDSIDQLRADHVAAETFLVPGTDTPYEYLGPAGKGGVLLHGAVNGADGMLSILTTDLKIERISAKELATRLGPGSGAR
jgi:hypothetical protein